MYQFWRASLSATNRAAPKINGLAVWPDTLSPIVYQSISEYPALWMDIAGDPTNACGGLDRGTDTEWSWAPKVKQRLAGIRMLVNRFIGSKMVPHNPTATVREPEAQHGDGQDAKALVAAMNTGDLIGLHDAVCGLALLLRHRLLRLRSESRLMERRHILAGLVVTSVSNILV